jgi:hypothetical protein
MRKFMFTICLAECFVRRAIIRFLNHGLSRINWFEKRRALHFRHPVKSDPPRAIRFRFPVLSKPRGQRRRPSSITSTGAARNFHCESEPSYGWRVCAPGRGPRAILAENRRRSANRLSLSSITSFCPLRKAQLSGQVLQRFIPCEPK